MMHMRLKKAMMNCRAKKITTMMMKKNMKTRTS